MFHLFMIFYFFFKSKNIYVLQFFRGNKWDGFFCFLFIQIYFFSVVDKQFYSWTNFWYFFLYFNKNMLSFDLHVCIKYVDFMDWCILKDWLVISIFYFILVFFWNLFLNFPFFLNFPLSFLSFSPTLISPHQILPLFFPSFSYRFKSKVPKQYLSFSFTWWVLNSTVYWTCQSRAVGRVHREGLLRGVEEKRR